MSAAADCPKCERELASDGYCDHCDHYVLVDGSIVYPEDMAAEEEA